MAVVILIGILFLIALAIAGSRSRTKSQQGMSVLPARQAAPDSSEPRVAPRVRTEISNLLPLSFVVLDLETTGLNPNRDEIIEIGAIRAILNSEHHATFQTLVKSTCRVPPKISKMTGITQAMVDSEGIPIADALGQFIEFIGDLPLVTFNAEFDMGFLCAAAKRNGITISNRYACALKRARRAWPGLASYRLTELAKMGNLSDDDTHRALGDCRRALIIFISATSKLGQKVRWTKPVSGVG
jgi:DNA polymerase III epsilon subunit family exonuclease